LHCIAQNEDSDAQVVVGTALVSLSSVRGIDTTEFVSEIVWAAHPTRRSAPIACPTARNE
jgi:hypothetical protein